MWPDYHPTDKSKWTVLPAPDVSASWVAALTKIAGLNPYGQPVLVWRWGATYADPMSMDGGLKYWLANTEPTLSHFEFTDPITGMLLSVKRDVDIPPAILIAQPKYTHTELGERRIIIERWRSREFLARSGRYTEASVMDNGDSDDYAFCRNCHTELTIPLDGKLQPCVNCGSKRHYVKTEREAGHGQLLKTNPAEGCYDFLLRLENQLGEPMEADALALRNIEHLWRETQKSEREKLKDMLVATEPQRSLNERATSPTNPFIAPAI